MNKATRKTLDLQQIFSWLLKDRLIEKDDAKAAFNQAQGVLRNGPTKMHPLTALAQCKLRSAQPPHPMLTLEWLTEWLAK